MNFCSSAEKSNQFIKTTREKVKKNNKKNIAGFTYHKQKRKDEEQNR